MHAVVVVAATTALARSVAVLAATVTGVPTAVGRFRGAFVGAFLFRSNNHRFSRVII